MDSVKPTYSEKGVQLYLGDCLSIMKSIPDKSIDLVLTDPPYGVNKAEWDKEMPIVWFGDVLRILKNTGAVYIFGNPLTISKFQVYWETKGIDWKCRATWIREEVIGNEKTWANKHDDCLVFHSENHIQKTPKEKSIWQDPRWGDYRYLGDVWKCGRIAGNNVERTEHPIQKPLKIIKNIIYASSKESDTILDPFMGSGTTGVACKELGRNFIGIEISPKYFEIAQRRINQTCENLL